MGRWKTENKWMKDDQFERQGRQEFLYLGTERPPSEARRQKKSRRKDGMENYPVGIIIRVASSSS